jgi:hypothetical protein
MPRPCGNTACVWQYGLFEEECEKSGLSPRDNFAAWDQLRIDMCVAAAVEAEDEALQRVEAVTKEIRETPAKTFAELAVKARALRFDTHLSTQCDLPEKDQDWPEEVMNQFVAERMPCRCGGCMMAKPKARAANVVPFPVTPDPAHKMAVEAAEKLFEVLSQL